MIPVDLPKPVEDGLRKVFDSRLNDAILEGLVVEGFRTAQLSIGQVARMLNMSIDQANGFMKARRVEQDGPTLEDIRRESDELERRLRGRSL
jgi:hypothetical protein